MIPFSSSFTPVILAELHVIFISDTGWIYISIWIYLSIYLSTHPCFYLSTGNVRLAQPAGNLDCKYVTKLLKHAVFLKLAEKQPHLYPHCADSIPVLLTEARFSFIKPIFLLEKRHQIFIGKNIHPYKRKVSVSSFVRKKNPNLMFLAFAISSGQSFLLRNGGDPKGARQELRK